MTELHEAANAGSLSDLPMERCVVELSKKVPRKHGFDEPDRPAICMLAKTDSRAENLHIGALTQASRCDMFPLGLSPQAEPPVTRLLARNFRSS